MFKLLNKNRPLVTQC